MYEREEGKGALFRVVLPPVASTPSLEVVSVTQSSNPQPPRRGRVLVVDDDPMVATAIQRVLSADQEVTVVSSGREALTLLTRGAPCDVILCDLMMPVMTGMDLHNELSRSAPEIAEKLVFMTGGIFTLAARAFLDKVPNQRFEKPFVSNTLRALVRSAVKRATRDNT